MASIPTRALDNVVPLLDLWQVLPPERRDVVWSAIGRIAQREVAMAEGTGRYESISHAEMRRAVMVGRYEATRRP